MSPSSRRSVLARRARAALALAASLSLGALLAAAGCGSSSGCDELCEGDARCRADVDAASCASLCEKQVAADEAYAEAVEARAECYEDASCDEILSGQCDGDGD